MSCPALEAVPCRACVRGMHSGRRHRASTPEKLSLELELELFFNIIVDTGVDVFGLA